MDPREERLARNEMLFREVNERIEGIALTHPQDDHRYKFLCECSNRDCNLMLPLSLGTYEEARADPAVFVVAPGHELPEIEEVVERRDGYQLVRKFGAAAELAE